VEEIKKIRLNISSLKIFAKVLLNCVKPLLSVKYNCFDKRIAMAAQNAAIAVNFILVSLLIPFWWRSQLTINAGDCGSPLPLSKFCGKLESFMFIKSCG